MKTLENPSEKLERHFASDFKGDIVSAQHFMKKCTGLWHLGSTYTCLQIVKNTTIEYSCPA